MSMLAVTGHIGEPTAAPWSGWLNFSWKEKIQLLGTSSKREINLSLGMQQVFPFPLWFINCVISCSWLQWLLVLECWWNGHWCQKIPESHMELPFCFLRDSANPLLSLKYLKLLPQYSWRSLVRNLDTLEVDVPHVDTIGLKGMLTWIFGKS